MIPRHLWGWWGWRHHHCACWLQGHFLHPCHHDTTPAGHTPVIKKEQFLIPIKQWEINFIVCITAHHSHGRMGQVKADDLWPTLLCHTSTSKHHAYISHTHANVSSSQELRVRLWQSGSVRLGRAGLENSWRLTHRLVLASLLSADFRRLTPLYRSPHLDLSSFVSSDCLFYLISRHKPWMYQDVAAAQLPFHPHKRTHAHMPRPPHNTHELTRQTGEWSVRG